jgi:hypothetical protein
MSYEHVNTRVRNDMNEHKERSLDSSICKRVRDALFYMMVTKFESSDS